MSGQAQAVGLQKLQQQLPLCLLPHAVAQTPTEYGSDLSVHATVCDRLTVLLQVMTVRWHVLV